MATHLIPGAVVANRYRLDRLLGEGGMGVIWAATHLVSGERIALKLLRPGAPDDELTRRRFLREARAAAAVHHPNVLAFHDVLELGDGTPVLVMDLLVGESLRDKLVREHRIPLPELARILLPVISAVGTAHARGIIHRDLKPDNIFLKADGADAGRGESAQVQVLDFGIAKLTAADGEAQRTAGLTDTGALVGTPYYMSPEQILGEHDVDHRADVWSLGVIVYECITAVRPTEADNVGKVLKRILTASIRPIRELAPDLPADVASMVDRMLSADRGARPADLREVGALLERYAAITFRPFGPPAPLNAARDVADTAAAEASTAVFERKALAGAGNMLSTLPTGARPPSVPPPVLAASPSPPPAAAASHPRRAWRLAAACGLLFAASVAIALLFWSRRHDAGMAPSAPPARTRGASAAPR